MDGGDAGAMFVFLAVAGPLAVLSALALWVLDRGRIRGVRFRTSPRREPPLWSGLDAVSALLLYFALMVLFRMVWATIAPADALDSAWSATPALIFAGAGAWAYIWVVVRVRLGQPLASLGLQKAPWANIVPTVLVLALSIVPIVFVTALWSEFLEAITGRPAPQQETVRVFRESVERGEAATLISLVVAAVVLAPLNEELLLRGFLFGMLRSRWGFVPALVVSSLVFGIYHFHAGAFLPLAVVGGLLAYVYHRTGSLYFAVLWHALFNAGSMAWMALGEWAEPAASFAIAQGLAPG